MRSRLLPLVLVAIAVAIGCTDDGTVTSSSLRSRRGASATDAAGGVGGTSAPTSSTAVNGTVPGGGPAASPSSGWIYVSPGPSPSPTPTPAPLPSVPTPTPKPSGSGHN